MAFLISLLLAGCASAPKVPFIQPIQVDDEVRISKEFRREARKSLKMVTHPEVERYVDGVGQKILSAMGPQPYEYRFFVVENPELNAFAVPGGSVFVHTGLLEQVRTTDELAGVLGHEIIHIKGRHIARMSGPDPLSLLGLLGVFLAGGGPQAQAAGALGQAVAAARQLSYTRQLEQEADALGVKYMAEAGFDPQGALGFLKLIEQERTLNPVDIPPYLMTHPVTAERIAGMEAAIRSFGLKGPGSEHRADPLKRIQTIMRLEENEAQSLLLQYEKLLKQDPQSPELTHLLGIVYAYQGRWSEARQNYERARAIDPKRPGIDRDLGRLYLRTGEMAKARGALERALQAEPKEPLNYLYLGEWFEKEAKFSEAAGAYLNARRLSESWAEPAHRLALLYGKMNRLGDAYYYLARFHLLLDEDEKAIQNMERAVKAFGEHSPRGQIIKEEIASLKRQPR